jgi:hypothetical protein
VFCQPICTVNYAVVTQDTLKNLKFGLSPKDVEWANGLQKKYPGVCYTSDNAHANVVLFIGQAPDTYHGTLSVTDTATTTSPTDSTVHYDTSSTHEEPYSLMKSRTRLTMGYSRWWSSVLIPMDL